MKHLILISSLVSFLSAQLCFAGPYGAAQSSDQEAYGSIISDITFNGIQKNLPGVPVGTIPIGPIGPIGGGYGPGPIGGGPSGGGSYGGGNGVFPGGLGVALFYESPQDFRDFPTDLKPIHRPLSENECKIQAIVKQEACGKKENREACEVAILSLSHPDVDIRSSSDDMNNRVTEILKRVKDEKCSEKPDTDSLFCEGPNGPVVVVPTPTAVSEPSSIALILLGLGALGWFSFFSN